MTNVLTPGERFAERYVVESLIAEGGMASIYRARDEKTRRLVAIKVLYPYYSDNRVIRARFIEEGRIQQMLGHPNVVHVQQVVEEPLAIVMEHIDGITLDDFLAEQGQIAEADMLDIIIPVMSALGMAHSKGIIHRDLKPSNILLNRSRAGGFEPKVMDFGVAKVKDAGHDLTATGTTVGTLHYMSPEQIVGSKSIDGRADIYSIGVTLYKLATGEVPFNAPTEFALMMAQVEAPPLPPSKLRPDLSTEFEAVILKAMEKKPADRFQSIRQFTTALLSMKREGDSTVRDTITETISQELLDMAMAADEVAQDRTGEMNLRVVRDRVIDEVDASMEPTIEIEKTLKMGRVEDEQSPGDSTVELSNSQILRMSDIDDDSTDDEFFNHFAENESTHVLENRASSRAARQSQLMEDSSQNVTRPSRAVRSADADASDSGETRSLNRRVRVDSGRVVVLDEDADSRDFTAPKVSQEQYRRAMGKEPLPRPSGPKVVLGYNPADTTEKTFEKPNYRTKLPAFKTANSSDFDKPDLEKLARETPDPRPPNTDPDASPPLPAADSRSLDERLDAASGPSVRPPEENPLPLALLIMGVLAIIVIVGCIALFAGLFLLG